MFHQVNKVRLSFIALLATTALIATACTKKNNGTAVTDKNTVNRQAITPTMKHSLENGTLTISTPSGQQLAQIPNVRRILGQPTAQFIAYEAQSPQSGVQRTVFHITKAAVANCGKNCKIILKDHFAAVILKNKATDENMAASLIDRDGANYFFASRVNRRGVLKQVKVKIGNNFAKITKANGRGILLHSQQGIIGKAKKIQVTNNFATAQVGGKSFLYTNSGQTIELGRRDRVLLKANFAMVDNGYDIQSYHAVKGLLSDKCRNCTLFSSRKLNNQSIRVGDQTIVASNNFALIPNGQGQAVLYSKDGQALIELSGGTLVRINNIFAGYASPARSQLFHVHRGSIADTGFRARIRLMDDQAQISVRGQGRLTFDRDGQQINNRRRRQRNN